MRVLIVCATGIIALNTGSYIYEPLEAYMLREVKIVLGTDPSEIFKSRLSFTFYYSICVITIVSSILYFKSFSPLSRALIPLISMLLISSVCIIYKKHEIAPFIEHGQPVNINNLNLHYCPLLSAISGFLMILTFFYAKHKGSQDEALD